MFSVTIIIIVLTSLVSVVAFSNREVFLRLLFNPFVIKSRKQYERFITHGFVHSGWAHLTINMFVLYFFGSIAEQYYVFHFGKFGIFYYICLYLGALIVSSLHSYKKNIENYNYNAVGASGSVAAVLFATVLFQPMSKVFVFPLPFGVPAIIFAIFYLVYSWYMDKKNVDNIGHDAHFWGAVFGFVFTLALKPTLILYFVSKIAGR